MLSSTAWAAPVNPPPHSPKTIPSLTLELTTGIPHQKVSVATDLMRWDTWDLTEDRPGHYTISFDEPWTHELVYKFVVDGQWRTDPANPATVSDGHGGLNSVREITGFKEDPLLTLQPGVQALAASELGLTDLEGAPRKISVLSPVDGRASVTVYFQDGADYLEQAAGLLANLSAESGFPAITGVFIPPKERTREYELTAVYADFVTTVVVPAVERAHPSTGGSRTRRLLIGDSLGGLITLYTALRSPQVFGYAASQSGSLWFQDLALVQALGTPVTDPAKRLKLFLDCGTYETPDMLDSNRRGAEAARAAGHEVTYREYPSAHEWVPWRNQLQGILRGFF